MKITKARLKEIIKEELELVTEAGRRRFGPEKGRNMVVHTQEPDKGVGRVLAVGPQGVLVKWEDGTQQFSDPGVIMTVEDYEHKKSKGY